MRLLGPTNSGRVVKPDWKKLVANGRWYQSESPSWIPSWYDEKTWPSHCAVTMPTSTAAPMVATRAAVEVLVRLDVRVAAAAGAPGSSVIGPPSSARDADRRATSPTATPMATRSSVTGQRRNQPTVPSSCGTVMNTASAPVISARRAGAPCHDGNQRARASYAPNASAPTIAASRTTPNRYCATLTVRRGAGRGCAER